MATNEKIIIEVPFEPDAAFKIKVLAWFKEHIPHDFDLVFKTNAALIGGIALIYKGYYKDYSIKKALSDYNFLQYLT